MFRCRIAALPTVVTRMSEVRILAPEPIYKMDSIVRRLLIGVRYGLVSRQLDSGSLGKSVIHIYIPLVEYYAKLTRSLGGIKDNGRYTRLT